ncbi:MAG: hypothetical protein ACQEW8_12605 [Actinomycetota bacterium]
MSASALRARAVSFAFDTVLRVLALIAVVLPLTFLIGVPSELATAPAAVRESFVDEVHTLSTLSAVMLSAIYASFRYTMDHRDGVVSRQITLTRRLPAFAARLPFALAGGVVIAAGTVIATHLVALAAWGVGEVEAWTVARTVCFAAVGAVWGLSLGVIVRMHLLALVVVPLSLGGALPLAGFLPAIAAWLPLPLGARAFGFDLESIGVGGGEGITAVAAGAVLALFLAVAVGVAFRLFLMRDVV